MPPRQPCSPPHDICPVAWDQLGLGTGTPVGCAFACTSVCECAHMHTAQMDSNRQRLQKHVPTVLIAAACGSYKYSDSRTKIGIYALLRLQKSLHQAGEDGQRQPPFPKHISCPSRTELTGLGASPGGDTRRPGHTVPSVTASL